MASEEMLSSIKFSKTLKNNMLLTLLYACDSPPRMSAGASNGIALWQFL